MFEFICSIKICLFKKKKQNKKTKVENKQILFQTDFSHCIFGLQLTEKSKIMSFH